MSVSLSTPSLAAPVGSTSFFSLPPSALNPAISLSATRPVSRPGEDEPPPHSDSDPDESGFHFRTAPLVSGYIMGERVGGGGMSVVYEALRVAGGERLAIKFDRPRKGGRASSFDIETTIMECLEHPRIVPLVDHGATADGVRWLAMPLVLGRTLRTLLDHVEGRSILERGRLVERLLVPALLDICEAVDYAHGLGVLHCDLKPSNMLVTMDRRAQLFDWGMARSFDVRTAVPQNESTRGRSPLGGTPGYMSPEQILGDFDRVGPWSDVWSLGAVLYEIVTGQRAYRRDGPVEMIRATLRKMPTLPQVRVDLPTSALALGAVCGRAMSRSPARRPPTVADFAADLREAMRSAA